jgi:regulator of protease activity HflC (stomatin/prohibitin superfamily)
VVVVNVSPFVVAAVDLDVATSDGVAVRVSGELQGRVIDPVAAALKAVDHQEATRQVLQTAMRALVLGRPAAELHDGRHELHAGVTERVADACRSWGVVVTSLSFDIAAVSGR